MKTEQTWKMLEQIRQLPVSEQTALLQLPSSGTAVYTALQVINEMEHYSSWDITVSVGNAGGVSYFAALWTQYRMNTQDQLMRAVDAMTAEYNPISNYDMLEQSADGHRRGDLTDTVTPTGGTESKTYRYGIDSGTDGELSDRSEVLPKSGTKTETKHVHTNDQSMDFDTGTLTGYNEATEHYLKRSGNIGVTTSAQMITGEVELRKIDLLRDYIREFFNRYGYAVGGDRE